MVVVVVMVIIVVVIDFKVISWLLSDKRVLDGDYVPSAPAFATAATN